MERQKIIMASFNGEGIQALLDISKDYLNNPLVIISANYNIIAYSGKDQVKDQVWLEAIKRGFITLEFGLNISEWNKFSKEGKNYLEFDKINGRVRRFYKLEYRNHLLGYLNVLQNNSFSVVDDEDYEFIVKVISKEVYSSTYDVHIDKTYSAEDILYSLHNEEFRSKFHYLQRVDKSNIANYSTYQIIIIDVSKFVSYNAAVDNLKSEIMMLFKKCYLITGLQRIYILVCDEEVELNYKTKIFLEKYDFEFNVSSSFNDLYLYKEYEQEADEVLSLKKNTNKKKPITYFDDIKIYEMLIKFDYVRGYNHYLDNKVKAIIEYDKEHNTKLLLTLYTYLKNDKSVKIVSNELNVHRNTVNYRTKQLKDIFLINFNDFESCIQIYTSIILYKMYCQ